MPLRFRYNESKALEALLYVLEQGCVNMYNALKALYFADKRHLERYGRFISGDRYVKMKSGPVPSGVYDLVKDVRDNRQPSGSIDAKGIFEFVSPYIMRPLRKANRSMLSATDIECLDEAIRFCSTTDHSILKQRSHDSAYNAASMNCEIPLEDIARTLPDGELVVEYLQSL